MPGSADWSLPGLTTGYLSTLPDLTDRDVDAITLCVGSPTNIPTGAIRYLRASDKFQEWSGAVWVDKVIALVGGGTGATTAAGARTNLGLGTVSTQDANAIAITGGTIGGAVVIDAVTVASVAGSHIPQAALGTGSVGAGGKALFDDQTYKAITAETSIIVAAVQTADFTPSLTEKPTLYPLSGSHTITLPTVVANAGKRIILVNRSTGTWTINCAGGQTILGAASLSFGFGRYGSIVLIADANNNLWDII